ncbi:hypothetical protein BVAVS116_E0019 (plasmid) [Borreliella valaisiana VS116]|uniref:Uncharacterized protein n=1 Tax=Borreliella valaisiana VS116 TaxID=445987 RepID=C0R8Q1_BORVA|nr:hypothetical protein BVAVS116_E0019 [Borreliella valaisiana VS116]
MLPNNDQERVLSRMGEKIYEYLSSLRSTIKLLYLSFIALKLLGFIHVTPPASPPPNFSFFYFAS